LDKKLFIQAIGKYLPGVLLVSVLLFIPAGTLNYLYGIVRHPMYASTILLFLSMPLVFGSFFSFIIFGLSCHVDIVPKVCRVRRPQT